jgi:flavin-dependent dehydrogenase
LAFCRRYGIDIARRTQTIAGAIPYRYDLSALAMPGLAIVGDAGGITNPMNGAGIHPGLFSGRIAGECAVTALADENPGAMLAYDRILRDSPFLDPLLPWMIERVRTWSDALMDSVTEELQGLEWRAVDARLVVRTILRKPWLVRHARDFLRMIRTLELCDRYGW